MENQQNRPMKTNKELDSKLIKKVISICLSGGSIPEGKHITLSFKPKPGEERQEWMKQKLPQLLKRLGEPIAFRQGPILQGMGVLCIVCTFDEKELYTGESMPHVTMECLDGTPPATSNVLINAYVQESGPFEPNQFDAGFIGYISAMYYSKGSKQYSKTIKDWEVKNG